MRQRVWSSPGHLSLRHLLIATIYSTSIIPAQAVSEIRDQAVTVDQATAQIKTGLKDWQSAELQITSMNNSPCLELRTHE
jgi:hypothetical protein